MNSVFRSIAFLAATAVLLSSAPVDGRKDLEADLAAGWVESGKVTSKLVRVEGVSGQVHYLVAAPDTFTVTVLLLHGAAFSADTWQKSVGALDACYNAGLRAVAIDLPGYRFSPGRKQSLAERNTFVVSFLAAAHLEATPFIVVAASMGGSYAIPFIWQKQHIHAQKHTIIGYISAGAQLVCEGCVATDVPAMVVWGSQDHPESAKVKHYSDLFSSMQKVVMQDAPHPCYLRDREAAQTFVSILLQFAGAQPLAPIRDKDQSVELHLQASGASQDKDSL